MSNYSRSKQYFKKYPPKKRPKAISVANKALKIAKMNRTYEHNLLTFTDTMTGTNTPDILYLQPPDAEGEKQTIQYIQYDLAVTQNLTSSLNDSVRVDLVLDRQPNGAIIDPAIVYGDATPGATALPDYAQRDRYKIVKSWSMIFNESTSVARVLRGKCSSGLISENKDGSSVQANAIKNAYYLVYWSDAAANFPVIRGNIQVVSITA